MTTVFLQAFLHIFTGETDKNDKKRMARKQSVRHAHIMSHAGQPNANLKFSVKPFSKGRRVPVAHKQGADRSGSGDFAGVKGATPLQ